MRSVPLILLLVFGLVAGAAAQIDSADLGAEVRAVFIHRCAECHGSELRKPKGKFGYVADLDRVRAKFVGDAPIEDSDLWLCLTDDYEPMPPKKAKNGPLLDTELDLVKRWLTAGAPAPRPQSAKPAPESPEQTAADFPAALADQDVEQDEPATGLGALHPLVVHFPIALVLVAALAELLVWRFRSAHEQTVRLCLMIGAGGALLAAISGWATAEDEGYRDAVVFNHRWLGVAATAAVLLALATIEVGRRKESRVFLGLGRLFLLAAAILTALAGPEGGLLVHGPIAIF